MTLTPQEIAELERLLEKVTKGPWEAKLMDAIYPLAKERIGVWKKDAWGCVGPDPAGSEWDAKFKAAARNLMPRLLADLKAAREALEKYGIHMIPCPQALPPGTTSDKPCTCGFTAALHQPRGEEKR